MGIITPSANPDICAVHKSGNGTSRRWSAGSFGELRLWDDGHLLAEARNSA